LARAKREIVVNEDTETQTSLQSSESLVTSSPRRIKLDAIALILEIGDMNYNNKNNAVNNENRGLRATLEELSSDINGFEEYLSLLHRKGFIEYDHKDINTYRITQRGFHLLQLYQKVVMWLH
jgi:predicted transcriptional regulator